MQELHSKSCVTATRARSDTLHRPVQGPTTLQCNKNISKSHKARDAHRSAHILQAPTLVRLMSHPASVPYFSSQIRFLSLVLTHALCPHPHESNLVYVVCVPACALALLSSISAMAQVQLWCFTQQYSAQAGQYGMRL